MYLVSQKDYIAHHGIKGQKWGVRRFQNEDGSLTPAGKTRLAKTLEKNLHKERDARLRGRSINDKKRKEVLDQLDQEWRKTDAYKRHEKAQRAYNESVGKKDELEKENDFYNVHFDTYKFGGPWSKHVESYVDRFSEALLSDIGIEANRDTISVARDWVYKRGMNV